MRPGVVQEAAAQPEAGDITVQEETKQQREITSLYEGWIRDLKNHVEHGFDLDQDGALSAEELTAFCQAIGVEFEDMHESMTHLKQVLATNTNGDVTVNGLISYYSREAQSDPAHVLRDLNSLGVQRTEVPPPSTVVVPARPKKLKSKSFFRTKLHSAAETGDTNLVRGLIESGIDVDDQDESGNTALMLATERSHVDIVTMLLDIFEADSSIGAMVTKWTCLHFAAVHDHLEAGSIILDRCSARTLVDRQDARGRTAVHLAARWGHTGFLRLLVEKGKARIDLRDECRKLAIDAAYAHAHWDAVGYLEETAEEETFAETELK